jgi:putative colanic acid biosynthesis UDP-glucose lipid carrier transferase
MVLGPMMLILLLLSRVIERLLVKHFRQLGRNTRNVTFVGNDPELLTLYNKLVGDTTKGYKFLGYYADEDFADMPDNVQLERLGTLQGFLEAIDSDDAPSVGDELYVSISRKERHTIRKISRFCDGRVVRFYYVPVSVETLGMDLKREFLDDMEVFTTYELPLRSTVNRIIKRLFDIVMSVIALLCLLPILPVIWIIVKTQSPGPLLFKQLRTGIDGKNFCCYKFRSMHVNDDADKLQATKNDPRKYAFGNFMRKANIDELPQFWNVLLGNMSVVGPRPHMLAHTEMYSQLIGKYMVRHFAKPGITGWAQVTGFRGETKELWQMEGRVQRDIWYIEHWSFWLDLRIIWLTFKSMFVHDEHAY